MIASEFDTPRDTSFTCKIDLRSPETEAASQSTHGSRTGGTSRRRRGLRLQRHDLAVAPLAVDEAPDVLPAHVESR